MGAYTARALIEKLDEVEQRFERLTADLSSPAVLADSARLQKLSRERASIEKLVDTWRVFKKLRQEIAGNKELAESGDAEMKALAREELPSLEAKHAALEEALKTRDAVPRCGLVVVDIETGRTLHWLRFEHTIDELYDVALLPGVRQAEALGFQGDDLAGAVEPEVA